jgi:hypothetical protein
MRTLAKSLVLLAASAAPAFAQFSGSANIGNIQFL